MTIELRSANVRSRSMLTKMQIDVNCTLESQLRSLETPRQKIPYVKNATMFSLTYVLPTKPCSKTKSLNMYHTYGTQWYRLKNYKL